MNLHVPLIVRLTEALPDVNPVSVQDILNGGEVKPLMHPIDCFEEAQIIQGKFAYQVAKNSDLKKVPVVFVKGTDEEILYLQVKLAQPNSM